ncbi:UNVERIFIED_CONTAM: Gibberellin 2-beta-dioxygenase 1 [Sesamum angustifolium]|uniref:Gibberellin 2-beta-dioxygenase 1 n=1 Tax=Sesamum angustifolium TaxID=2727405 RepID=A0AAW2KY18_9LAMI
MSLDRPLQARLHNPAREGLRGLRILQTHQPLRPNSIHHPTRIRSPQFLLSPPLRQANGRAARPVWLRKQQDWPEWRCRVGRIPAPHHPHRIRLPEVRVHLRGSSGEIPKMACEILEMLADGLKIQPRNAFSKLLMDEESDSVFRVNHYPPLEESGGGNLIGFGAHTDPQIISVLRSNNTSGLQIWLKDGKWISVPPDQNSFFINVGDSLQVGTGRKFLKWLGERGEL